MKDVLIAYYNPEKRDFSLFRPLNPPYVMARISGKLKDLTDFDNMQYCRGGFFDTKHLEKYNLVYRIID